MQRLLSTDRYIYICHHRNGCQSCQQRVSLCRTIDQMWSSALILNGCPTGRLGIEPHNHWSKLLPLQRKQNVKLCSCLNKSCCWTEFLRTGCPKNGVLQKGGAPTSNSLSSCPRFKWEYFRAYPASVRQSQPIIQALLDVSCPMLYTHSMSESIPQSEAVAALLRLVGCGYGVGCVIRFVIDIGLKEIDLKPAYLIANSAAQTLWIRMIRMASIWHSIHVIIYTWLLTIYVFYSFHGPRLTQCNHPPESSLFSSLFVPAFFGRCQGGRWFVAPSWGGWVNKNAPT